MKVGNLVKRCDTFKEWLKEGNSWMTLEEEQEIGIIIEYDKDLLVIHWSHTGISWEDEVNVEVINENR